MCVYKLCFEHVTNKIEKKTANKVLNYISTWTGCVTFTILLKEHEKNSLYKKVY